MSTRAPLLDISGFNSIPALSPSEREALTSLGWHLLRRRSYDPALPQWRDIQRLLAPLDAARLAMRDQPDSPLHRRSSLDAAGLVLFRCAEEGIAFSGWPEEAWVRLIGEDRHASSGPGRAGWTKRCAPTLRLTATCFAASAPCTGWALSTASRSSSA